MAIEVLPHDPRWPQQFAQVAADLRRALVDVPSARVEHVGSTSVPGLAAKPVLDIDVLVDPDDRAQHAAAVDALRSLGYRPLGDLGIAGRDAFAAPDEQPRRNVYLCRAGTLHVRNHLAVRDVLRRRPDLRDAYAAVKQRLAQDPDMDIDAYLAGKSAVLQQVLATAGFTDDELRAIRRLNDPGHREP
ncbi:GrpB family protein [Kineococcus sp. SYSU DK006]|uniref:GrpB family protein n=1 Tax=Kineococcus sp. SYSU DK006 TaxID=3383127 RepID=UPI003D7CA39D